MVKRGEDVLVIFPEGEIYYLNDLVQPFKSGAVEIGMRAVVERRAVQPDWTAYLVPLAIKYRYRQAIGPILERKTRLMEQHLFHESGSESLPRRLALILGELLHRQEIFHDLIPEQDRRIELTERVQAARQAVLSQMESAYPARPPTSRRGQSIEPGASAPTCASCSGRPGSTATKLALAFASTSQRLSVWQRWERGTRTTWIWIRRRNVWRKWSSSWSGKFTGSSGHASSPIAMSSCALENRSTSGNSYGSYLEDAHTVRHAVAERLRAVIQALIDDIVMRRSRKNECA